MNSAKRQADVPNTPLWEKVMGLVGFLLLCSGIVYLTWMALTEKDLPPEFLFEIKYIHELDSGFLVEVDVANGGSQSVAALYIEARLDNNGEVIERSEAEFDYLPSRSNNTAGLFFHNDPRAHHLTFKALGYQTP